MSNQNFPNRPGQMKEKASEAMSSASSAMEQAKSTASKAAQDIGHKAQQAASTVAEKGREAMHQAGEQADRAAASVGTQMASAADNLRSRLPGDGMMHEAGERVASAMEAGGHYLEEQKLSGSMQDLTELVKKYPLQSIAIGVGIGFLFARMFTSNRDA